MPAVSTVKLTRKEWVDLVSLVVSDLGIVKAQAILVEALGKDRAMGLIKNKEGKALTKEENAKIVKALYEAAPGVDRNAKIAWAIRLGRKAFESEERFQQVLAYARSRIEEYEKPTDAPSIPSPAQGTGELVNTISGRYSHIAVDFDGQPHIVFDMPGKSLFYLCSRVGDSWTTQSFEFNSGTQQAYNPHIEINNDNQAWISCVRWYPEAMRVVVIGDINTKSPQVLANEPTTAGMSKGSLPVGFVSLDPELDNTAVLFAGNGGFYDLVKVEDGRIKSLKKGSIGSGRGGEKNAFTISRSTSLVNDKAVWHACTDWSYNNSVRSDNKKRLVTWSDFNKYPMMGSDYCYPGICADLIKPQTAYMFADFTQFGGPGLMMNVWEGSDKTGNGALLRPKDNLFLIDPKGTSGGPRFGVQATPAKNGGCYVVYTVGKNTVIKFIPPSLDTFSVVDKFPGRLGSITSDAEGNLHVTYVNSGRKYRKIKV